jgi:hypothetical protein
MKLRRWASIILLAALATLATASSAAAIPGIPEGGCDAPSPAAPDYGLAMPPQTHPTGDPFAAHPTASVAEVYGLGGFTWNTCDLGPTDLGSISATTIANFVMMFPRMFLSVLDLILVPAYHPELWTHALDGAVIAVTDSVRTMFWSPGTGGASWASLLTMTAAVVMMVRYVHRGQLSRIIGSVVAIGAIAAVVGIMFGAPAKVGALADNIVAPTLTGVTGELAKHSPRPGDDLGRSAWGTAADAVLYRRWLQGEFGSDTSQTATKYGPCLFKASAFSWVEKEAYDRDPSGAGKQIVDRKAADWKRCTNEIKGSDPAAYKVVTGKDGGARIASAFGANVVAMTGLPMITWSAFMLMIAYLIVRVMVMFGPIVLLMALLPGSHGLAVAMLRTVLGCIINSIVFGVSAAVMLLTMSQLMAPSSGLNVFVAALLNLALGVVAWYALRPFRRMTSIGGFANPAAAASADARHARRWMWRTASNYASASWGARHGTNKALEDQAKPKAAPDTTSYRRSDMDPERVGYTIPTDTDYLRPALTGRPAPKVALGPGTRIDVEARDLTEQEKAAARQQPETAGTRRPGTWAPVRADSGPLPQPPPRRAIPATATKPPVPTAETVSTGTAEDWMGGYQPTGRVVDDEGGAVVLFTRKDGFHEDTDINASDATAGQPGGEQ